MVGSVWIDASPLTCHLHTLGAEQAEQVAVSRGSCTAFKPLDDDHVAGMLLVLRRLGRIGDGRLDGIDRNEWRHEQLASPIERFGDIVAYPILGGLHHRYART
jgi:hypothetical protein